MERVKVRSAAVASVDYDPARRVLEVELVGGAVYRYAPVPPEVHAALLAAGSIGAYYNAAVRDRYRYERVEPGDG